MRLPGRLSLRRFRVEGSIGDPAELFVQMSRRSFAPLASSEASADEIRGWSSFENFLDIEPEEASWTRWGRIFFGLRVDRRRAPASLVRARVAIEERIRREASGKAVLPARIRAEIREEVKREIAEKTPPTHHHYPAIWNLDRREIVLFSTSETVADTFRDEFRATFDRKLVTLRPAWRARTLDLPESAVAALDAIRPTVFSGTGDTDAPVDEFEVHRLLGREFLTWLWHRVERDEGAFSWDDLGTYGAMIGQSIVLDADEIAGTRDSFRRGYPADEAEVRVALLSGKKVASIEIVLAREEAEWRSNLIAPTLDASGLKLPRSTADHPDDRLQEGLDHLDEFNAVLDRLLREFLLERLGPEWERGAGEMRSWIHAVRERIAGPELVGASTPSF